MGHSGSESVSTERSTLYLCGLCSAKVEPHAPEGLCAKRGHDAPAVPITVTPDMSPEQQADVLRLEVMLRTS
jgi:hypothetical protein